MDISEETKKKLKSYPNVIGTGYGFKYSGGKITDRKAIIVFVSKKVGKELLSEDNLIPKFVGTIPTDVRVLKVKALAEDPNFYRPSPGGCSVGHFSITAGTLGAWVRYKDRYCVLSNNHVLANSNEGAIGDRILQPGPYDDGKFTIAHLFEFQEIFFDGGNPTECELAQLIELLMNFFLGFFGRSTRARFIKQAEPNYVDAAVAEALEPVNDVVKNEILDIGKISMATVAPTLGMRVQKRGRTTRKTSGFVSALNVDVEVSGYGNGYAVALFQDQVIIETEDNSEFSAGGDSGSLILNESLNPVGLLFAGGEDENGRLVTVANHIDRITEAFPGLQFI